METLFKIGNCSSIIDWTEVIAEIEDKEPAYIGPRQSLNDPTIKEIADLWIPAGYRATRDGGSAEWHMFYPGRHFDPVILTRFLEFAEISRYNSAWVSRIMPGHCAPIHRDLQNPDTINPYRVHCHMDTPVVGHVLIVEDQYLYNQTQGETYKWGDPLAWHSSFNLGLKPSYIFNIY